jgi:hypothetical protein
VDNGSGSVSEWPVIRPESARQVRMQFDFTYEWPTPENPGSHDV